MCVPMSCAAVSKVIWLNNLLKEFSNQPVTNLEQR